MAVNNIRGLSSKLIGKNINLNSYKGDITFINSPNTTDKSVDYEIDSSMWGDSYYSPYGQSAELSSSDNLNINSGYNLKLKDVIFSKNKHINLTANNDISISDNILNSTCTEECNHFSINGKIKYFLSPERSMKSTDSINIASGGNITLKGLTLSTDGDIFLNSIKDISLIPKNKIGNSYTYNTRLINHEGRPSDVEYSPTGFAAEDFGTRIFTKNGIISSGGNIFGNTVQINTKNNLLIRSGNNIKLAASDYENRTGSNATNKFETTENISISNIHTSGNLTLLANNVISMVASKLSTGGDMNLSAGGSIGFEAANAHTKNFHISESGGFYETISDLSKITPRTVELNSSKNLSILTEGNILFQATKLMAKGAMNIAAKGGYLYAQAQEDISHYTTKSSSRRARSRMFFSQK
ncbi:hemagglutinin repeat-containing protein [Photorhabdus hindustanensis]|uniref:Uncharacterized protein n=1 Tax=Photorhabdus hindustanensis TaxID=2918802 RepID=A0A2S8PWW1_9GAMM|nr:hemagglutinin repeat-containing protein [Photorhabdus hindustanensis]PQQ23519.1 hypothetical protein C6H66_18840 [Photorhabdus hindustanensis]